MKKYATIWLATAIATIMSMPGYAATTWLVDPAGYENGVNNWDWRLAENIAQFEKFANDNLATVNAAGSDTEKVRVAATLISDYLSHDDKYTNLNVNYVMRDHKGVCDHYSYLMQALMGKAGLTCYFVAGGAGTGANAGAHGWNIVYIDGTPKWVDVTWYDTSERIETYLISDTLWTDHRVDNGQTGMTAADYVASHQNALRTDNYKIFSNGGIFTEDGGETVDTTKVPVGTTAITGISGQIIYVDENDWNGFVAGTISEEQMVAKYPGF